MTFQELTVAGQAALLLRPDDARWLFVMAHGAGAGMRHAFMEEMAQRLALRGIATLRWEMTYRSAGRRVPDRGPVCEREAGAVCREAAERFIELPMVAGGKSMGGRMTSQAYAAAPWPRMRGLVLLGFPLHPSGRPATTRAAHLEGIELPMLLVQGRRDKLAEPALLEATVTRLPGATLRWIEGADHGFEVAAKRRAERHPLDQAADEVTGWLANLTLDPSRQ